MKRVYVCSPYRGHPNGLDEAKSLAIKICKTVEKNHHSPFAPHLIYPLWLDDKTKRDREEATDMGCAWLAVADVLLSYEQFGVSEGMKEEIEIALEMEIPVLHFDSIECINLHFKKEYENGSDEL